MFTYLFFGDSITASQRLWTPSGDGLGNGYVSMLAPHLKARAAGNFCGTEKSRLRGEARPLDGSSKTTVINKGYDGFTVPALLRLIKQDISWEQADHITIQIGINDVGIAMNTGCSLEKQMFSDNYALLLQKLTANTPAHILCVGPFLFPYPQEYTGWIPTVRQAEAILSQVSQQFHLPFLPLHDTLNDTALQMGYDAITTDGIHLTPLGHQKMAELLLPFYR